MKENWSNKQYGIEYLNLLRGQTIYVFPEKEDQGWAWGRLVEDNGVDRQGWFPPAFATPRSSKASSTAVGNLEMPRQLQPKAPPNLPPDSIAAIGVTGPDTPPTPPPTGAKFVRSQPPPPPPKNGGVALQNTPRTAMQAEPLPLQSAKTPPLGLARSDIFNEPRQRPFIVEGRGNIDSTSVVAIRPTITHDYWGALYTRCLNEGLIKGGKAHMDQGGTQWWHCPFCEHDIRAENLESHLGKQSHIKWYEHIMTLRHHAAASQAEPSNNLQLMSMQQATCVGTLSPPPIPETWGDKRMYKWDVGYGAYKCLLCDRWTDDNHVSSKAHQRYAPMADQFIPAMRDAPQPTMTPGLQNEPTQPWNSQPACSSDSWVPPTIPGSQDGVGLQANLPEGWRATYSEQQRTYYYWQLDDKTGLPAPDSVTWHKPVRRVPPPPPNPPMSVGRQPPPPPATTFEI